MEEIPGRQLLINDREKWMYSQNTWLLRPAIIIDKEIVCQRCGQKIAKEHCQLPNGSYYCPFCLQFGRRVTSKDWLLSKKTKLKQPHDVHFTWTGQLTSAQRSIALNLKTNVTEKRHSLVWAVTGSGKTEMIFPVVCQVLREGGRVAIASPRIDVCHELFPRICEVFPDEAPLLLYGDSEEKYRFTHLMICTTHQLVHFYQEFDLLIIDEIDAFPFEGNAMLHYFVHQAIKEEGCFIYLTATPPQHLLDEIKDDFRIEKLPIRFHKRPLIVPELVWLEDWRNCYKKKRRMNKFLQLLQELLSENDVLVFCPSISYMQALHQKAAAHFSSSEITSVSSQDSLREEKVQKMRDKMYRVLFTTTILERGVTFENISVIVMGANHPVFSKSALVQIVGRVDRKGAYNHGRAIFFYDQMTPSIRQACHEIKEMNRLAKRWQSDEM